MEKSTATYEDFVAQTKAELVEKLVSGEISQEEYVKAMESLAQAESK